MTKKQKTAKKLAIVGSHPGTRGNAPWDDPTFEIWVLNEAPMQDWCVRWDASFQLHKRDVYASPNNYIHREHWKWLQVQRHKPIYMQAVDPEVPDSVAYPLADILSGPGGEENWIDSSPAYALALGLHMAGKGLFSEIHVYGMELYSNSEYSYQLPNYAYWVGVARGLGVPLMLHFVLLPYAKRLYGYEGEVQLDFGFFQERAKGWRAAYLEADRALKRMKSALEKAMEKSRYEQVADLVVKFNEAAMACGKNAGALAQAERYAKRMEDGGPETVGPIPRQEFEFNSAKAQAEGEEKRAKMYHTGGKAEYVWSVWKATGQAEALKQLRMYIGQTSEFAYQNGAMVGAFEENMLYLKEYDARVKAAGGVRSVNAVFNPAVPE